jgi:hypothetical protein
VSGCVRALGVFCLLELTVRGCGIHFVPLFGVVLALTSALADATLAARLHLVGSGIKHACGGRINKSREQALFTSLPAKCSLAVGNTPYSTVSASTVSTGGTVCSRALPPIISRPPLATNSFDLRAASEIPSAWSSTPQTQ